MDELTEVLVFDNAIGDRPTRMHREPQNVNNT